MPKALLATFDSPTPSFMAPRSALVLLQFTIYVSAAIITETS